MYFDEAINITKETLKNCGSIIDTKEYDGLIVKKLESSNTLDEGRSTNQSHIAITGEQMSMFPYLVTDGYFNADYDKADQTLKKYFIGQIPVYLHRENVQYLDSTSSIFSDNVYKVYVSVLPSRRKDASLQIQMSLTTKDSPEFVEFRKLIHAGSYMIMFKQKEKLMYDIYAVKNADAERGVNNLSALNKKFYHMATNTLVEIDKHQDSIRRLLVYHTGLAAKYSRNRIIFGAPGTGKSYKLEEDKKDLLHENPDNSSEHIGDYERVTFHPDYTYSQFVGTYKPVSEGKDIYYKFVPGPFMRIYVEALKNGIKSAESKNPEPFVLLIEEINRAPVSAVFGDVFQLLDRDSNGVSQYEIEASEDVRKYLSEELGGDPSDYKKIKIPDNMFIWASMNSADQGVFPMDTAFKRRWDFTYIGVNDNEAPISNKYVTVGRSSSQKVEWNSLRRAINNFLARNKINEDKQLGPFFLSKDIVAPEGNEIDKSRFEDAFTNKVIMYLFEDAARQKRSQLFKGCFEKNSRYSEICEEFREKGIGIFNEDIQIEADPIDLSGTEEKTETVEKTE